MNFTTPPNRQFVRLGRPHDYVYDPVYTSGSRKDFFKDASRGAQQSGRIQMRPIYRSMFSELMRDRRLAPCLIMQKPNVLENFMPQHQIQGLPVSPMTTCGPFTREVEVTGADRARFVMKYAPATYKMARPMVDYNNLENEQRQNEMKKRARRPVVSQGCQTMYRTSETQTDPYTPPHVLPYPEAYPKVLALIKMTWGRGLPATLEDIVVIERALTRRILELGSRDLESVIDLESRAKLMEELEAQQWADREKELDNIMAQKMEIVNRMLLDLKNKIVNEHTMKMEKAYKTGKAENMRYLAALKHRYMREERRLDAKYTGPPKQFKRDIVKEYIQLDSQVYAPLSRNGPNLDMLYKAPPTDFNQIHGYDELERITSSKKFTKEMEFDTEGFIKKTRKIKLPGKDRRMKKKLENLYDAFLNELNRKKEVDDATLLKDMIARRRQLRTPEIQGPTREEEQRDQATLILQRTIRGRAVQTIMRNEIRNNMETILEMKALHKADPYGLKATYGEISQMQNLQAQREEQQETQNEVTEITDQLEGEALGRMLEFLDKEMVRLLDEKKIHALMLLAERERRMREATEAGNRQKEERLRRTNDEIFRHIVGIQQGTVDLYLEDMYLETMNRTADEDARLHVQSLARAVNDAAYLADSKFGVDVEELSADIIHSFLIPEMNRIYQRQRMDDINSRYTDLAQQVSDSLCSAKGVVAEVLDSLAPVLEEHMARGIAATEGTQIALETFIKEAVKNMMGRLDPTVEGEAPRREVKEEWSDSDIQVVVAPVSARQTPKIKAPPKVKTEGEEEEGTDQQWKPLPAPPCLETLLGLKSVEITYGTEVGVPATMFYHDMLVAADQILQETRENLNCTTDDEFTENELDDDDDIN